MTRPWLKFYPSDWRGDENLALCSLAARGLLVELMCLMHKAEPYGHLLVNGAKPADPDLARMVRTDVESLQDAIRELLARGVLSVTAGAGVIVSRRMLRDAEREAEGRAHGRTGGNPKLLGHPKPEAAPAPKGAKRWQFTGLVVTPKMHAVIAEAAGRVPVDWDRLYELAACDYLEKGQPANRLDDLQARARKAAGQVRSDAAAAEVQARTREKLEAVDDMTPERRAELLEQLRRDRPLAVRAR